MYVHLCLFTRVGLSGLDPSPEEAAASPGADRRAILRRVTLPPLRPVLMTSLAGETRGATG
jgi:ABC-type Fe3+ transport system permease subunit